MRRYLSFLVIGAILSGLAAGRLDLRAQTSAASIPIQTYFADIVAKETAVRKALAASSPAPALLKAVRTVVADFETVIYRYPSSDQCDDALWRAARLSSDAYAALGDPQEQGAAVRLLNTLTARYPSSPYAKQAAGQLTALNAPPDKVQAAAKIPAKIEPVAKIPVPYEKTTPVPKTAGDLGIATIMDIRRAVIGDVVRIVIELDREVSFHDERLDNPSRVFVDLPSTRAVAALKDQTIQFAADADLVRQVRLGRHPNNTTRVVLESSGVSSYSVYPLYSPYRLVIDCLRDRPADPASPVAAPVAPAVAAPVAPPVAAALPVPVASPVAVPMADVVAALVVQPRPVVPTPPKPVAFPKPAAPPLLFGRKLEPSTGGLFNVTPMATAAIAEALAEPEPVPLAPIAATITAPPPSVPLSAPARNLAGGFSLARQLGLTVSRIVIDPGHGGRDPGAKGGGTTEAELVLDVSLRLEQLLGKIPGVEVVLTRRTDEFVPLQERTAIANREDADLFLSIHANANPSATIHGVETYFLNFATNLSAAAVAARENAASGQSMGELPDVVKTIALHNKLDESRDLATYVQRELMTKLRPANKTLRDLGVKQAPFVVLIGAAMPSVLAEVSFMTNAQEAKLLKSSPYRQRIAEALFDAVRKYQSSLNTVPSVARQSDQ